MKEYQAMLNALNKVAVTSLTQRNIREAALTLLASKINEAGFDVTYVPGRGFVVTERIYVARLMAIKGDKK